MGKFSKELDQALADKVKNISIEMGIKSYGINVMPVLLKKGKTFGCVIKGNDVSKLFGMEDDTIVVALNEKFFNEINDEKDEDFYIRTLLAEVSYDLEKDKMIINKPEINIPLSIYQEFGNVAAQKMEAAVHILNQIEEREKEEKAMKKGK